ncbi:putative PKS/NRPS-like protein biosynthetic cluster [Lepraria neglecta]|uniref:PKS/NRPS-like protein biosynthetic cluster n=1 Tax=Lepraria neglecta TaxID=209136 RepID=A0AAD9ZC26_9LECA|nr:putative PKS/NRPS-like protein biosynthetic cluster [Lepraria neglecta]
MLQIPQKLEPLPNLERASVNSFGYGGVNAHAILERASTQMANLYHCHQTIKGETCANGRKLLTEGRNETRNDETGPQVHQLAPVPCRLSQHSQGQSDIQRAPIEEFRDVFEGESNTGQSLKNIERRLFLVTGNTQQKVLAIANNIRCWTSAQSGAGLDLDSLAYTLASRRSMHQWRHTFQAGSRDEFLLRLSGNIVSTKSSKALRLLFIFTGQGAQWHAMGRELNLKYPVFRDSLLQSDEILRDLGTSWALVRELERGEKDSRIHQSDIAQPSSTALQIALIALLASFGVRPATVIGHSSGEIAAAYAAGAISHRTALKVSFCRSLLSTVCKQKISSKGAMLSVGLGESQVSPLLLETRKGVVSLACVNSSSSTTVSGDEPAIVELQERLDDSGIFNRKLKVDTAYHSHHMRRVAHDYLCSLGTIENNTIDDQVTFISSVTGTQKNKDFGSDYWVDNLIFKVRFLDAVKEYCNLELGRSYSRAANHLSIELGPHGALAGPFRQTMTEVAGSLTYSYSPVLTRGRDAVESILSLSGWLFEYGYPVDIQSVNCLSKSNSRLRVLQNLPTYPWDHSTTYWQESRLSRSYRMRQNPCHDLLGIRITSSPSLEPSWRYVCSIESLPWLADHVVDGLITFPGAGYVCMAIEASKELAKDKGLDPQSFVVESVSFMKALVVPPAPKTVELQICFRPQLLGQTLWDEFRIYALSEYDDWHEQCRGRILANPASDPRSGDPQSREPELAETHLMRSCKLSAYDIYSQLQANGNTYGPCFACIKELRIADSQAIGYVIIPDIKSTMPAGYQQPHVIHPTTLDALLHTALPLYERQYGPQPVMPVFIEELTVFPHISNTPGDGLFAAVELYPNGERSAFVDISVSGDGVMTDKQPLLTISRIKLLGVGDPETGRSSSSDRRDMAYQMQWIPEITAKAQESVENSPDLGIGIRSLDDKSLLSSLRSTKFSPCEACKMGDESEQLGAHINLIAAHSCRKFATMLTVLLNKDGHEVTPATWASRAVTAQATYVVLDDSEQPFLESPTEALFQSITKRIDLVSTIIWVSTRFGKADAVSSSYPKSALITGFARSARAEHEQLRFTTLDILDDIGKDSQAVSRAAAEVVQRSLKGCDELEYVYHLSQMLVPRLVLDPQINNIMAQANEPPVEEVLYSRSKDYLAFDVDSFNCRNGVYFTDSSAASGLPKPTEVEVEALAHSFDPRHIVQAKGRMARSLPVIREFAGTVRAIGSKAQTTLKKGDTVIGWNLHDSAYVNYPRTEICNVTRIPSRLSLPVATAMAIPLIATYYSLIEIAKLREGHSILIHEASGVYGQLAIAMAKSTGAKILATVATPAQREDFATTFSLPPSRFLSERDWRLKRNVIRLTDGKGADVVVAMPSDRPAPDLGGCVAVLGVYVQISRAGDDINVILPKFTRRDISFVSLDVDTIARHQPGKLAYSLEKAVSMLPERFTPSTSIKCIAVSQIEEALAESRKLESIENIVLTAEANTKVRVRRRDLAYSYRGACNLRPDATYVIAGGLGDLGQRASALMAKYGAKHLVLLSRRSLTPAKIDSLQEGLQQHSPGLKLYAIDCDITKSSAVSDIARKLESLKLPPTRGVLQSAAVIKDRVLEHMSAEDWQVPLQTKMHGTQNLDEAFRSSPLDFFVMLSSLSGVIGTRGQANYAAGNTYQDAFALSRESTQTAYIALDLGMIEDSATYGNKAGQVRAQNLLRQGLIPIKSEQLSAIFEWALSPDTWRRGSGQFAIGIDGASIHEAENATPTTKSAMFTQVRGTRKIKAPARKALSLGDKTSIMAANTLEKAKVVISEAISQKAASLISVGKEDFDQDRSLQDFGLDSLTAIEVKNFIRQNFDAAVNASEILDEPSMATLSDKVASRSGLLREKFGNPISGSKSGITSQIASPVEFAIEICNTSEENKLPALPLPSVEDTIDLYLTSARPFLKAKDFERTSEAARVFKRKSGKLLQEKLEVRKKNPELDNWLYDLQVSGVYLRRRLPIHPFGTFYGVHPLTERAHGQAERAAIIAETAYALQKRLEANELEPDYLNDERLCPQSLSWLFNTCREPHRNVDRIRKHERNRYLIVLRRGHAFKIALEQESQPVTRAKLRAAIDEILHISSQMLPSIATLTADDRDSWAELRGVVMSMSLQNEKILNTIEAAAFLICLDDESPSTPTERCNSLLLGDPGNRWSDKTLQFVVCANGVSGYVCEHSMLDAVSVRQINSSITTAIVEATSESEHHATVHSNSRIWEEFRFHTNEILRDEIDSLHNHVRTTFKPVEFVHFKLPSIGNKLLRNRRIPSKSGVQIVIQLASLLYYGLQYPSWETMTMMLFRGGRLDWMQSVSTAMFTFCEAAFNDEVPLAQRSKMLREAAGTHASTMTRVSRGRGFAAHLEALREVAQREEALPAFFDDPTWEMMRVLSSRKLKTDASVGLKAQEAGFFMPDPESFFVHYEIDELECQFFVQSTEGRTDLFCKALEKAAEQILRLLEEH